MRKAIIYLTIYILSCICYVNAQTDTALRIGEQGFLVEVKQNVLKGIYLGGQFRDFGDDIETRRTGILTTGFNFVRNDVGNFYIDAGYGYHNQFMYGVSADIRVTKGFYFSAAFDNLNWLTAGVKIRLSDVQKSRNCNCNWRRK